MNAIHERVPVMQVAHVGSKLHPHALQRVHVCMHAWRGVAWGHVRAQPGRQSVWPCPSAHFSPAALPCRVYKYVPYGRVEKVIPYLLRRMNETQYAARAGRHELALISQELLRRAALATGASGAASAEQEAAGC